MVWDYINHLLKKKVLMKINKMKEGADFKDLPVAA